MKTFDTKIKLGNIRNPWDWYVSLWAFGCMEKGGLYNRVTKKHLRKTLEEKGETSPQPSLKNADLWLEVYEDAYSPELFRAWLKLMLKRPKVNIGEGYKKSPIFKHVGFFTYRYLKMYNYDNENQIEGLRNFRKVKQFDAENNFIDIIIRTEHINEDLLDNAPKLGITKEELQAVIDKFSNKTNASSRQAYPFYYDKQTKDLVAKKDKLIIEKYGYNYDN